MDSIGDFSSSTWAVSSTMDSQTFGAQVVTKTLDTMNSGNSFGSSSGSDYDFQKSVLSAAYGGKGGFSNLIV